MQGALNWVERNAGRIGLLLVLLLSALYFSTAFHSYGYDDEYYNIRQVREHGFLNLYLTMQQTDLHPPLSYIINKLLYLLLGDWTWVRMSSSFFFLSSLFYLYRKTQDPLGGLLLLIFIGFNPSVLLWTTSIRWYAYVLPLLVLLHAAPSYQSKWYWRYFFIISFLICMLAYIGFLFVPIYFIYYFINDKNAVRVKLKRISLPVVLFAILYAWQFYVFLTVHSKSELPTNQQIFSLKESVRSYVSSVLANQGLFPLTLFGMVAMAGMGAIGIYSIVNIKRFLTVNRPFFLFLGLSILLIITGVAGKIRNLFLLEPAKASLISMGRNGRANWLFIVGCALILVGNLSGVRNVIRHEKTTKNAWNIQMSAALAFLWEKERPGKEVFYFTHHPSFSYHLTQEKRKVISFYNDLYFDSSMITARVAQMDTTRPCDIIFLINYKGRSISVNQFKAMMSSIKEMTSHAAAVDSFYLQEDTDFMVKRKYFQDYPRFTTIVYRLQDVRPERKVLSVWERNDP